MTLQSQYRDHKHRRSHDVGAGDSTKPHPYRGVIREASINALDTGGEPSTLPPSVSLSSNTAMSDVEKYGDKSPDVNVYHHDAGSYNEKVGGEGELQRKLKTRHIAMIR